MSLSWSCTHAMVTATREQCGHSSLVAITIAYTVECQNCVKVETPVFHCTAMIINKQVLQLAKVSNSVNRRQALTERDPVCIEAISSNEQSPFVLRLE